MDTASFLPPALAPSLQSVVPPEVHTDVHRSGRSNTAHAF